MTPVPNTSAPNPAGRGPLTPNMVGGASAKIKEFPYLAQIRAHPFEVPHCSATLIDQQHLVTAAHCVLTADE